MIRVLNILGVNDRNRIDVVVNKGDMLKSELNFSGNLPLLEFLKPTGVTFTKVVLGGHKSSRIDIGNVDIAFNSICDADANIQTLENAIEIIETLNLKVINKPQKILETTRDKIYKKMKDAETFFMPKTLRVNPQYVKDIIKLIEDNEISLPFIFREAGAHGGKSSLLVHSLDEIQNLQSFAFDGREYYITEYVDFCGNDGLYRKYRIIVVDGKPYMRHMVASKNWAIHAGTREELMVEEEYLRAEEKIFFKEGTTKFSLMIEEITQKVGLDFFGFDFSVMKDGRPILFEANACMNSLSMSHKTTQFAYHLEKVEAIKEAVVEMIEERMWK
jgi:glutathione synthase/RimK-type ligase-like ATP-grasp enzyme